MDSVLEALLEELWAEKQNDLAGKRIKSWEKKHGKKPVPDEVKALKPFEEGWVPWEWSTFLQFGPPSGAPVNALNVEKGGICISTRQSRDQKRKASYSSTSCESTSKKRSTEVSELFNMVSETNKALALANDNDLLQMQLRFGSPRTKERAQRRLSLSLPDPEEDTL